ncbi:4-hydroxy-tetrahydrodipicolinate reductase [Enterococcus bulliens]|uniref:4-hydroxy-tetrahydrodipicolinate reductase n=1 Tax=uncultured Enterococcus sp. TaxID=167972 RepID=UPI0025D254AF|nr:4-hydroxy-tetrahydrodipicolinate reductase [uncultured Enterococcus sp.]
MLSIILSGANGRMGRVIQEIVSQHEQLQIVAGIDRHQADTPFPLYNSLEEVNEQADVIIDFSHYSNVETLLATSVQKKLPIVVATTGLSEDHFALLDQAATDIPVFYSANMSLGINVLIQALKTITPTLEADFDIEIIEKHHNQKKDAPSGTALLLADSINETCRQKKTYVYGRSGNENENPRTELGIHAVRGGTIPGEHTVLYAGLDELIELKHTALSRDIFANGAIKAAQFLATQAPGRYSMAELITKN